MARTLRELKDFLKLADLVFETSDARIPATSRNPELHRLVGQKPLVLVLNKADLADPAVTALWLDWYRQHGETALACDSRRRSNLAALGKTAREIMRPKTEKALAAGRLVRPIRVMVVGIPNTGKSTLINALIGRKSAATSDKPGLTRQIGWMRSGSDLELLDSPGVLPPHLGDAESQLLLAATGAIREDRLPIEEIASRCMVLMAALYPGMLKERYHLDDPDLGFPLEMLDRATLRRGCLMTGGRPDRTRFAAMFLNELRGGQVGRITLEKPARS